MKKLFPFFLFFFFLLNLNASDFETGKQIFEDKCSKCHTGHISVPLIKENFFEKDNKILNLTIPSVNMLSYAIIDGPKKIGDLEDEEMRQIEIEEYLKDYLKKPDKFFSICDPIILKYYEDKKPMVISDEEAEALAIYFMQYQQRWDEANPDIKILSDNFNEMDVLNLAHKEDKKIIIFATSKTCYFCKKMKNEVLELEDIKKLIAKNFVFVNIDVDKMKLPFDLTQYYKKVTPTFFFLSKDGEYINSYPGAWKANDFKDLLNEHAN